MLGYCQSTASATVAETAQVEARTAPYFLFVTAATGTGPASTILAGQTLPVWESGLRD